MYKTKEEVFERAKEVVGKPFRLFEKSEEYLVQSKGSVGNLIQEEHFGTAVNSRPEADFVEIGVELKVTPYRQITNGYAAKERLVLNIIDYKKEALSAFDTSSFWTKNNTLLILFYEYKPLVPRTEWFVSHVYLWEIANDPELRQIRDDWEYIHQKITSGYAHELSEGQTMYLGACTKGKDSSSVRRQPASDVLAKQRAYSIKSSYMSVILAEVMSGTRTSLPRISSESSFNAFESKILTEVQKYVGMSQRALINLFEVSSSSKSVNAMLIARILGLNGVSVNKSAEFIQAGIVTKTIVVGKNQHIKEHMSFPAFNFIELSQETEWESSSIGTYLSSTKFFFVIFQKDENDELILRGVRFWSMPVADLARYELVWKKTVIAVQQSNLALLPKGSDNLIGHIRPHARNRDDALPLPDGTLATKRCFWLNNTYTIELVRDFLHPRR